MSATYLPVSLFFVVVYSGMLYILFALLLGAVCSRHALLTDYMIASKVSLVGVLFLFGLYISSLSSCLGAQYGAPRVLQCISKENVLPIIKPLGKGVRILGLQPRDKEAMLSDKKILTLFSWVNLAAVTSAVNQQLPHSLHFLSAFYPARGYQRFLARYSQGSNLDILILARSSNVRN